MLQFNTQTPDTTPRTFLNRVLRTIPKYFVDHSGRRIQVDVAERPAGHRAVLVKAVDGNPFDMSHGYGDYIVKDDKSIRWYDTKWVNADEIEVEQ